MFKFTTYYKAPIFDAKAWVDDYQKFLAAEKSCRESLSTIVKKIFFAPAHLVKRLNDGINSQILDSKWIEHLLSNHLAEMYSNFNTPENPYNNQWIKSKNQDRDAYIADHPHIILLRKAREEVGKLAQGYSLIKAVASPDQRFKTLLNTQYREALDSLCKQIPGQKAESDKTTPKPLTIIDNYYLQLNLIDTIEKGGDLSLRQELANVKTYHKENLKLSFGQFVTYKEELRRQEEEQVKQQEQDRLLKEEQLKLQLDQQQEEDRVRKEEQLKLQQGQQQDPVRKEEQLKLQQGQQQEEEQLKLQQSKQHEEDQLRPQEVQPKLQQSIQLEEEQRFPEEEQFKQQISNEQEEEPLKPQAEQQPKLQEEQQPMQQAEQPKLPEEQGPMQKVEQQPTPQEEQKRKQQEELKKAQFNLKIQLNLLEDIIKDFNLRQAKLKGNESKDIQAAIDAANKLLINLTQERDNYFVKPQNKNTYQGFVSNSKKHLTEAHLTLDKHRGWSELLVNILLAITGIGILLKGLENIATGHSFFFVHETKSSKVLHQIEKSIKDTEFTIGMKV